MRISHAATVFYSGALLGAATALKTPVEPRADGITPAEPLPPSDEFVPGAYIVELDDVEIADENDKGGIPESFYRSLADEDGIEVEHRMDLSSPRLLFKGASFQVLQNTTVGSAAEDQILKRDPGVEAEQRTKFLATVRAKPRVKNVWPVRIVKLRESMKLANNNKVNPNTEAPAVDARMSPPPSKAETPSNSIKRQEGGEGDAFSPHVITQVSQLRAAGITGQGLRIAVVDSGVDWKHPALGGCFGPGAGCVVEAGYDFTGDDFLPPGNPKPDNDPYDDCVGHGTHVAGIIAAQQLDGEDVEGGFNFTGAAPGVKLAVYRAWGCRATSTTEILIAAFKRAFEEGADVISCSDGDLSGWADDAWAVVASRIVEAGVPVVISEGNDGGSGLFQPSTPATGHGVTGVGASINTLFPVLFTAAAYTVGTEQEEEFGFLQGSPPFPADVKLPLWAAGNSTTPTGNDACTPLPDDTPDLSDKIVLLGLPSPGTNCYPNNQGANVAAKGGRYLLYYARDNLTLDEQFVYADNITGVAMVAPYQGALWLDLLLNQGETVTVAMPTNPNVTSNRLEELENTASGGYMADFSSWGPTWELAATPQLSAPGANILSTYLLNQGGYRVMSGTSMACPLVAAIYALMAEARGGTMDPALFRRLLTATSKPQTWFDRQTAHEGVIAPVPQQGAGIVQAYDAAHATAVLSIDGMDGAAIIAFNDSDHFVGEHTFSVQNTGAADLVFALGHDKAATMYTFVPGADVLRASAFPNPIVEGAAAEITFSSDTITVPAGGSTNVTITGTPPSTTTGSLNATLLPVYSGYITLTSASDSTNTTLRLPYLGVAGSLKSTPALQPARVYLADYNLPVEANRTYTLPRPDPAATPPRDDQSAQPNVMVGLTVGTRMLRVEVVGMGNQDNSETTLGSLPGYPLPFAPRDEKRAYFKGLLADGTALPAGPYKLRVSALRVFGDAEETGDWDVLETVPFNVEYK